LRTAKASSSAEIASPGSAIRARSLNCSIYTDLLAFAVPSVSINSRATSAMRWRSIATPTMLSTMRTLIEIWPPYGVSLIENDLKMTVITDDDISGLVDLALGGIHQPDRMPFATPWTAVEPDLLPANMVRYYSSVRASFTPENFELLFAVRIGGELVGTQGLHASDFAVTRTGETGSWLGRDFQGRGIGTRMRRAICAFAFDHLGAVELTSSAFLDNPASLAVSAKLGYRPNGLVRMARREGEVVVNQRLVLTPETFVREDPIEVTGAEELREFLQLG
jgi:RimJ/RimL family protein N-acetyltransferase